MMMRRAPRGQDGGPAAGGAGGAARRGRAQLPELDEFVSKGDYTGALTVLEFKRRSGEVDEQTLPWIAYCAFHLGDYRKALDTYTDMLEQGAPPEVNNFAACCHFYLQEYQEASAAVGRGVDNDLAHRILFQVALKGGDDRELMTAHARLRDIKLDQLSLAAVHFLRGHYQEAIDLYKRLLVDNRDAIALNVSIATCYYKLDYYDVALEILAVYLQQFPRSPVAVNLKACNHFRLYNGRAAEQELRVLADTPGGMEESDLIRHNLVVFRDGQNALRVLPSLVGFVPEARLNLIIYHLKHRELAAANELIEDMDPKIPIEYILKGIVNAMRGQAEGNRELVRKAQQFFQIVGASASECDTIPGRQCMASCFFLLQQFSDVFIYLDSIKAYMFNDDDFNWNYGLTLAATGKYKEAEEALLHITDVKYTSDAVYLSWLARCYIMTGKPKHAWDTYLRMETSPESLNLLQLIANDCYKMGQFYYAAKAFDVLERLDPDPEYWDGKRGACAGVLQQVIAGERHADSLKEIVEMLSVGSNPQQRHVAMVIARYMETLG